MDYYGLLFLYYLKGLSGKSILRLFFNIEVGGTEQLLPENTSTPTTTPILADIQYPDGLRTDQYFTYRETPTTVSNKARIKTIKGNTLVWNQQSENNRASFTAYGLTISCTDGLWSFQGTYTGENGSAFRCGRSDVPISAGHKVLLLNTSPWKVRLQGINNVPTYASTPQNRILEAVSGTLADIVVHAYGLTNGDTVNVQYRFGIIDLTVMFGETKANEIYAMEQATEGSGVAYFKSLFPLDYYPYNSGSLIPFMGNGIKTVGKNLINYLDVIGIGARNGTESLYGNYTSISDDELAINLAYGNNGGIFKGIQQFEMKQGEYVTISGNVVLNGTTKLVVGISNYNGGGTNNVNTEVTPTDGKFSITLDAKSDYPITGIFLQPMTANSSMVVRNLMVERGSVASNYVPYTESVINLPISTYFPTGMKSAGTVYDELTPTKSIIRIGAVTFNGSETWYYDSKNALFQCTVSGAIITDATTQYNVYTKNNRFDDKSWATRSEGSLGMYYGASIIFIKSTQFADVNALKTWLQSNPVTVYYVLATPTETPITTEDANEALSLLMGKSVSSNNAKQMIGIITKGE